MIFKGKSFWAGFGFLYQFLFVFICDKVYCKNIETVPVRKFDINNEVQEIWKVGLEEHNRYRQFHSVPPLQGNIQLHNDAQRHADYLAKTNKVELSPYTQYGENLATSFETNKQDAVREVVKRWYNRIVFFNFENPEENRNIPSSGPFCSIVWKLTAYMGIGVARNKYEDKWVIVVLYDLGANGINFRENVPPPKFDYQNVLDLFVNFLVNRHLLRHKNNDIAFARSLESSWELEEIWKVGLTYNRYRKLHSVHPLLIDRQLNKDAQKHADYLATTNKIQLSPYTQYGESIVTSKASNKLDAIREVVKSWYNKIVYFDFRSPEENQDRPIIAQFCSLIWKATTHMGIGVARNKYEHKWRIAVLYDPDANGINFRDNVPPPTLDRENVLEIFTNFLVNI